MFINVCSLDICHLHLPVSSLRPEQVVSVPEPSMVPGPWERLWTCVYTEHERRKADSWER